MDEKEKMNVYLHFIMCFMGGFIGAYALLNRMDTFGSAQTGNLIELVLSLLGKNRADFLIRLGAFLIYIVAIFITVVLTNKTKLNLRRYVLFVNTVGILILAFLPKEANPVLALYPIFFMTATQWSIFHGAKGYNCSTIFSTNNVKQTVLAFGNYCFKKEHKELEKGKFFLSSLICFHVGVGISYLAYLELGILATLVCFVPILVAFYISHRELVLIRISSRNDSDKQTVNA